MKATKLLLLILLSYCSIQVGYSQGKIASWFPDSLSSMVPIYEKQLAEWKQKTIENPKDEEAWLSYTHPVQMLRSITPGEMIEKEIAEIMKRMKQSIPNTATYAIIRKQLGTTREKRSMSFEEIMDKWPDALLHYHSYMMEAMTMEGDRLKDLSVRWYKSGTFPAEALNFAYNELASTDKDALIFVNVAADAFGSYILQYAKEQFKDKRIIVLPFLNSSIYMDKVTRELGIPEFKEERSDSGSVQPLADRRTSRINHLIEHSKRPVYFSISIPTWMISSFKEHLYGEGLLMKYSEKPYDNLAILRRNFENIYLMDYLKETFYPEIISTTMVDTKMAKALNFHYVTAFRSLLAFYKESDDQTHYDKLHQLLESIIKNAKFPSEDMREKYLKSINIQ